MIRKSKHAKVLDEKTVRELKSMIWDPKRKLSLKGIAARFGVSEMQIYRIKNGEFWFHIHVEHEPLHAKYKQNQKNLGKSKKGAKEKAILQAPVAVVTKKETAAKEKKEDRKKKKRKDKQEKDKKKKKSTKRSTKRRNTKNTNSISVYLLYVPGPTIP